MFQNKRLYKNGTVNEDDTGNTSSVESQETEKLDSAINHLKVDAESHQNGSESKSQKKNKSELLLSFLVDLVNKDVQDDPECKSLLGGQNKEVKELKLLVDQLKTEKEQQDNKLIQAKQDIEQLKNEKKIQDTSLEEARKEIEKLKWLQLKMEEESQCDLSKPLKSYLLSSVINHANAQDKAVCSRCTVFLKTEAYVCEEGHNICEKCKQGTNNCSICGNDLLKNWVINDLAKHLICKSNACKSQQLFRRHHRKCEMRPIMCALMGCKWKGPYVVLLDHLHEKHVFTQRVKNQKCVIRGFNELKRQGENKILILPLLAHGTVYWNYVRIDFESKKLHSFFKFGEAMVKPVDKISILSLKNDNNIEFTYTHQVYEYNVDQEEVFKNRKCLVIPFSMLEYFVDKEDNIQYTCEISTIDN